MSRTSLVIFVVSSLAIASTECVRYDNYHLYQVTAINEDQLAVLKDLDNTTEDRTLFFFDGVHIVNYPHSLVVSPDRVSELVQYLDSNEIPYELLDDNIQNQLDNENAEPYIALTEPADYNWLQYYKLNDTYSWLWSLVDQYPDQVEVYEIGKSYEDREILALRISYKEGNKAIFLESGIHAREWISITTVTYIINQLLTSTDSDVRFIAENYDWYIVPHTNPDGYEYTHTTDRLWRKTRTPYGYCFGADPNRNFDFHWNEIGASDDPCSEVYCGSAPFSEKETQALSDYITYLQDNLMLYVSFHSYSQLLLFPYGHTHELPENYDELKRILDVAIDAIGQRYGTIYYGGNICDTIYEVAGTSIDWTHSIGIKLSFAYELRPSSYSDGGFVLPADQIIPTGEETFDSLLAMVREADAVNQV